MPIYLPLNTAVVDQARRLTREWRDAFSALVTSGDVVPTTRTIGTTAPLTGGGALAANLTLGVTAATTSAVGVVELATDGETAAGVVVQGNDSRLAGHAPDDETYLTVSDETGTLANSRRLVAGSNITFDTTTPGELEIAASGGGGSIDRTVGLTIDGGGSAITTGQKGYIQVPYAGTITDWTLLADQSGSIVIDVWKDTYANAPPTDADSITASAPPTISAATKATDSTLTGWTTSVTAGDVFGFNVDSAATMTRATLTLTVAT